MDKKSVKGMIVVCAGCGVRKEHLRDDFFGSIALSPFQTHSINVKVVDSEDDFNIGDTDALVTFRENVTIGVRTADCVPILLYAEDVRGVGAVHAGWKGTLGGILEKTLDIFEDRGADMSKLKVAFGPSISSKYYEVSKELAERFIEAGFDESVSWPEGAGGKPHIDLQGVNIERLKHRGVLESNIEPSVFCTYESKNDNGEYIFPSYRRDAATPERLLTCVMMC